MPGFDGTGPQAQGSMTGARRGYCATVIPPTAGHPLTGDLYRGRGRSFRKCYYATGRPGWMRGLRGMPFGYAGAVRSGLNRSLTKDEELAYLKGQSEHLESELNDIRTRIEDLQKT